MARFDSLKATSLAHHSARKKDQSPNISFADAFGKTTQGPFHNGPTLHKHHNQRSSVPTPNPHNRTIDHTTTHNNKYQTTSKSLPSFSHFQEHYPHLNFSNIPGTTLRTLRTRLTNHLNITTMTHLTMRRRPKPSTRQRLMKRTLGLRIRKTYPANRTTNAAQNTMHPNLIHHKPPHP
jgi:hypothetical protein